MRGRYIYSTDIELQNGLHCELKLEVEYVAWDEERPVLIDITSKRVIDYSFYILDGLHCEDVEQSVADKYIVLYSPLDEVEDVEIEEAIREKLI